MKCIIVLFVSVLVNVTFGRHITSLKASSANNQFNIQLLNHLADDKTNVFVSPFSISTALAMVYTGAKGTTAQEMRRVLGYESADLSDQELREQYRSVAKQIDGLDSSKYELTEANKLVVQKGFNITDKFRNDLVQYFESAIESVDFGQQEQAVDEINKWVSRQTHNKITKLIDELNPATVMVLLNAIYFKGTFHTMFMKNETREEVFFTAENKENSVEMMNRTGKFNFTEIPELDSSLVEIPYSGDDISLYVLLPNQRQGLKNLKNRLNDFSVIDRSIGELREEKVEVMIPKFKLETKYSLTQKLSEMGVKSLFNGATDLSGIDGKYDLQVSDVIHKAYIEISEEGTEAAAATGVDIIRNAIPKTFHFKADHPFMFFIRNNVNGMVLFSGHINQI